MLEIKVQKTFPTWGEYLDWYYSRVQIARILGLSIEKIYWNRKVGSQSTYIGSYIVTKIKNDV